MGSPGAGTVSSSVGNGRSEWPRRTSRTRSKKGDGLEETPSSTGTDCDNGEGSGDEVLMPARVLAPAT